MDNTIRALRASEKVADAIPVPGLRAAISLALHIIETVEVCDYTYRLIRDLSLIIFHFSILGSCVNDAAN